MIRISMQDYLSTLGRERFRGDRYHLFENNCNNFSDVVARHLTGKGIPGYILELPEMVKNSPIAQLIAPIIEQARGNNLISKELITTSGIQKGNADRWGFCPRHIALKFFIGRRKRRC